MKHAAWTVQRLPIALHEIRRQPRATWETLQPCHNASDRDFSRCHAAARIEESLRHQLALRATISNENSTTDAPVGTSVVTSPTAPGIPIHCPLGNVTVAGPPLMV